MPWPRHPGPAWHGQGTVPSRATAHPLVHVEPGRPTACVFSCWTVPGQGGPAQFTPPVPNMTQTRPIYDFTSQMSMGQIGCEPNRPWPTWKRECISLSKVRTAQTSRPASRRKEGFFFIGSEGNPSNWLHLVRFLSFGLLFAGKIFTLFSRPQFQWRNSHCRFSSSCFQSLSLIGTKKRRKKSTFFHELLLFGQKLRPFVIFNQLLAMGCLCCFFFLEITVLIIIICSICVFIFSLFNEFHLGSHTQLDGFHTY